MPSASSSEHKKKASDKGPVTVAIVTVSDTRTAETDVNGRYLRARIEQSGDRVHSCRIIRDEPEQVEAALSELCDDPDVRIILLNGGTGMSRRDRTFDVVSRQLEKTLPGFGEIFRMLSYEQVGAAAMFSRAVAGVSRGTVIISTPGSPAAVALAWEKLIGPELRHLAWEVTR